MRPYGAIWGHLGPSGPPTSVRSAVIMARVAAAAEGIGVDKNYAKALELEL